MGSESVAVAVTKVRNELDALDVSLSQELERIEETKKAIAVLAKQETITHTKMREELKEGVEVQLSRDEWTALCSVRQRWQAKTIVDAQKEKQNGHGSSSVFESLDPFLTECSAFQSEFSESAFKKRYEEGRRGEALLREEIETLRHKKAHCQAVQQQLDSQKETRRKEIDKLHTSNAEAREKLSKAMTSSKNLDALLDKEKRDHCDRVREMQRRVSTLEGDVGQLRLSLSLQGIELADLLEKKRSMPGPTTPSVGLKTSQTGSQLSAKNNTAAPSPVQGLRPKRTRPEKTASPQQSTSSRKLISGRTTPPPKKRADAGGSKTQGTMAKSRTTTSPKTPSIERDAFGGIRH